MLARTRRRRTLAVLALVPLVAVPLAAMTSTSASASSASSASAASADAVPVPRGVIRPLPDHLVVGLALSEPLVRGPVAGVRVASGTLPPGVTLDSRALLTGTPTLAGSYNPTIEMRLPAPGTGRPAVVTLALPLRVDTSRETVQPGDVRWDEAADTFALTPTVVVDGEQASGPVSLRVVSGPARLLGGLTYDRVTSGSEAVLQARGSGTTTLELRTPASAPVRLLLRRGMGADLSVRIAGPARIAPGGTADYTFRVANAGPLAATGVVAAVEIPEGAGFVGTTCGGTVIGSRLLVTADGLAVGQTLSCTIGIGVPVEAGGASGVIRAGITSLVHDPKTSNNVRTVSLRVT